MWMAPSCDSSNNDHPTALQCRGAGAVHHTNTRRRSARVHRAERRSSLLTDRACSNRFFNLLLNSSHIETGTTLHRWEIDERLRRLRHLLLDEHEAPELVGEPVVIGD